MNEIIYHWKTCSSMTTDGYIHVYNNDSLINNKKLSYQQRRDLQETFWACDIGSDENSMISIQENQVS